jgi:S1-C subfamily serine protease
VLISAATANRCRTYYDENNQRIPPRTVIAKLVAGGQGERLGLKPGDVLLTYDNKVIASPKQFFADRAQEKTGQQPRVLRIRRGPDVLELRVTPGALGVTLSQPP